MSQMDFADVSSGYDEYCDLLKRGCFFIGGDLQNRIFSINDGTHNDPFNWTSANIHIYINRTYGVLELKRMTGRLCFISEMMEIRQEYQ